MPSGTVKWFNPEKGFGFIIPDEGGRDIFVHRSNVSGLDFGEALEEGQRVLYDTEETPKGIQAVDVEIEA